MRHKDRRYRIHQRRCHIVRRYGIIENTWGYSCNAERDENGRLVNVPVVGSLDKGKVHCSCGICRFKGYTWQDRRRMAGMEDRVHEAKVEIVSGPMLAKLRKGIHNSSREKGFGSAHAQKTREKVDYNLWENEQEYRWLSELYQAAIQEGYHEEAKKILAEMAILKDAMKTAAKS